MSTKTSKKMSFNFQLFVKHESGALHNLGARRSAKLWREIMADRGQPEIVALVEAGYVGFLSDGEGDIVDFEAGLKDHCERHAS
jgi:hypothetical protein